MYFGEFLLIKKVISEEQLLEALIYQLEHLPSFLRVLRDEKIFSSSEIVKIIQLQIENNTDLISVLRNEYKLDEKKLSNLYQKQTQNRKLLGSVVVELKFTSKIVIEEMLHEYLRDKDTFKSQSKAPVIEAKKEESEISEAALESMRELGLSVEEFTISTSVIPKPDLEISEAALESMRELGLSVEDFNEVSPQNETNIFVLEYLNIFKEKMHNKLGKILEILQQSVKDESDISNYLNSLYRDLFILKNAAKLAGLPYTENLLEKWSAIIESKMLLKNDKLIPWVGVIIPKLSESIDLLWNFRNLISRDKHEEEINNTPAFLESYSSIINSLN
jgi:hypothetical protein